MERQKGLTLWELIIVLVLAGIVAVMAAQPFSALFNVSITLEDELDAKADIAYAVQRMRQEVRRMDGNPCNGAINGADDGIELKTRDGRVFLYIGEETKIKTCEARGPDGFYEIVIEVDGESYDFGVTRRVL
ncbi:hypothetical protein CCR79_01950 [Halorhodospira halophila]|nr:hypothetical protein [Halorhodospira halophila]